MRGEAFARFYEANVGRIYATCLRMTADPILAEELTQEVFARAWRKRETFRGESRRSTWLHRMAVNVVFDALRRRGRETARDAALPDHHRAVNVAGRGAWRIDLENAVARLPERPRTALVLYAIEGYQYREIAELMGISLGTVKAHIHHARRLLMEDFE